jgi:4-amino-4-deoxy-L-arabinose transferase-like glycosyltransferase
MVRLKEKFSLKSVLLIILLLAFSAKIYTGYSLREQFLQRGNSKTYLNLIAYNLLLHDEFSVKTGTPSVDYEPLYPMLMSIAYRMTGNDWIGLTIIQAILHLITSLLIFFLTCKLWNQLAGFIASLYHAFYPYLFTYTLSIYDTTVFVFILVGLLYLTIKEKHKPIHLILAGILIGLGLLSRGTVLTFIPPVLLYVFYKGFVEKGFLNATINCTMIIVATIVTMSPWLIRNYNYTGRILVSTHGPFGLWQGNNQFTEYYLSKNISLDEIYRRKPSPEIYAQFPMDERKPEEAVKIADAYKEEAVSWIKTHPKEFVNLAFLKAQKLWTWNRNPVSSNPKFGSNEGRQSVNLISYLPLLICFPLGLLFLYKKNKPAALLIIAILICFTGAHMIAIGFTRARIPIDFILMICFGITAAHLIEGKLEKK